jgi:hypothetical protein
MKNSSDKQVAADLAKLPELCYAAIPGEEVLCVIQRGESGYFRTDFPIGQADPKKFAADMNERLGVSKAQANAMVHGSMFGWHVPSADPNNPLNKTEAL